MSDDVKIRVVLDTKDAQTALNSLGLGSGQGGGSTSTGSTAPAGGGGGGGGIGGFGLGKIAGIAAAIGLSRPLLGPSVSGFGDIIGEKFGATGTQLEMAAFGNMPAEARASMQARKSVEDTFAYQTGRSGLPAQAKASYDAQFARNFLKEKGIQQIEADPQFRKDAVDVAGFVEKILGKIAEGFDHLGDKIVSAVKNHH